MDVIFCRNVLMYFTPEQRIKVVGKLREALMPDGWLALSPTEISSSLLTGFQPHNFPGAILHRKSAEKAHPPANWQPPVETVAAPSAAMMRPAAAGELGPRKPLRARSPKPPPGEQIRALANEGRLQAALERCDQWLAEEKLHAPAHYLRAVVLQEMGEREQARRSLLRALYLEPTLAVAHFALGNLARDAGREQEAARSFRNALELVERMPPDEPVLEADQLAAGRLREIIASLLSMEPAV
jgi:chemotaxis protein methyltransferase CheR